MNPPLQLLWVGAAVPVQLGASAYGPFTVDHCDSLEAAARSLHTAAHDAVVFCLARPGMADALADWPSWSQAVLDAAVVVLLPDLTPPLATRLVHGGVQDLLPPSGTDDLGRVLRLAVERKRLERTARKAYATDLGTGLPNHAQLLEHITHLLALREREPAPMALLVLRIEGLSGAALALGDEAANVLRRKLAVRLRAALRASDVVAAIGHDAFAVLLAWIDAPADALCVADKLQRALQQPIAVAGQPQAVSVAVGLSQYPEHGRQADALLRRALGQAGAGAALAERSRTAAANDE